MPMSLALARTSSAVRGSSGFIRSKVMHVSVERRARVHKRVGSTGWSVRFARQCVISCCVGPGMKVHGGKLRVENRLFLDFAS